MAGAQKRKCVLKYVMFTQSRKSTELFAPSVAASGYVFSPLLRKKCLIAIKGNKKKTTFNDLIKVRE